MTNLTELEQTADREARHAHRELVDRLQSENRELALQVLASQGQADDALGRVAELERQTDDRAYRIETLERERNVIAKDLHMVRRERDTAWNDAIRAAAERADEYADEWGEPIDEDDFAQSAADEARAIAKNIRTLLRNEEGSDDQ